MEIERVNVYADPRFRQEVLYQHGAYLADGEPWSFLIISDYEAVIEAPPHTPEALQEMIETFRFHAEHITTFYDESLEVLLRLPRIERREVKIEDLQPSQFSVDCEKCAAVGPFIHTARDIVIPVLPLPDGRLCVLDGHTRLYEAWRRGLRTAMVFESKSAEDMRKTLYGFVKEARKRGIYHIHEMACYSPERQKREWHDWCDAYFARQNEGGSDE